MAEQGFTLQDDAGNHLDVLLDGRIAARYMYAYDKSSPERLAETYKPYLHVFDAEGRQPITKGPGGLFPTTAASSSAGERSRSREGLRPLAHEGRRDRPPEVPRPKGRPEEAAFTSLTHWNDPAGKPILVEERTMTFHRGPRRCGSSSTSIPSSPPRGAK